MESSMSLPVVLNSSLEGSDIANYFKNLKYKVKISRTTEKNSVIFPRSSLAVIILTIDDVITKSPSTVQHSLSIPRPDLLDKNVLKSLERFASGNRKCYLVLMCARFGDRELAVFVSAQQFFSSSNLKILFAHSAKECVECITSIANATLKETCARAKENVEAMTKQRCQTRHHVFATLMCAGIKTEDVLSVYQGCGSVANVVSADIQHLESCTTLDRRTVEDVVKFFERNSYAE